MSDLYTWKKEPAGWYVSEAGEIVRSCGAWYLRPPNHERRIRGTSMHLTIGPLKTLAQAKRVAAELSGSPELQDALAPDWKQAAAPVRKR